MSPKHEDCDKCEVHPEWGEKLKMLEHIPELMTFMNQEKGGKATAKLLLSLFIGVPFTILLYLFTTTKADVADYKACTARSIEMISQSAAEISKNVAVLTSGFTMHREGNFKEHEAIRRDIPTMVANQINIEKNSGKK
jgi:hypothetical protein